MTTIVAFKENKRWHLSADSRVSMGSFYDDTFIKLGKSETVWYSIAGDARAYVKMARLPAPESTMELLDQFRSKNSGATMLAIDTEGKNLWLLTSTGYYQPITGKNFYAIGSGGDYATGALERGATPEQAIAIAKKYDAATGGPVRSTRKWK